MKEKEIKRLIELLISAHEEVYNCEGVCFLGPEEEKELNDLIERYKIDPNLKKEKILWRDFNPMRLNF